MRDSELAIGVVVLAVVIAGLLYFLFPIQMSRLIYGPTLSEIRQSVEEETTSFKAEAAEIASYLEDSLPMKAYAFIDSALKLNDYWVLEQKAEMESLLSETLKKTQIKSRIAERLSSLVESRKAALERLKKSPAPQNTRPLENEINHIQNYLDSEKTSLLEALRSFRDRRRSLNQKALIGWFIRSSLVAIPLSVIIAAAILFVASESRQSAPPSRSVRSFPFSPLRPKEPDGAALLSAVESPVLKDSAFSLKIRPKEGNIPPAIREALKDLAASRTATRLASMLGGHPEIPASRSHHSSFEGGLILHTAMCLKLSRPLLQNLSDPRMGVAAILAHDIGKILTLAGANGARPHDIASADILASLPELKEEFDETAARSLVIAVRHQHSSAEIPLNAPPLAHAILELIKKADSAAAAEETKETAEKLKAMSDKIVDAFPFVLADLNINGSNGGWPEGFLSDGHLFVLKEPLKKRLLIKTKAQDGPVFKGQDPVWNEIAEALARSGMILKKIGAKEAGKKSCLFTIKTEIGTEKAIALPASRLAPKVRAKWLSAGSRKVEIL